MKAKIYAGYSNSKFPVDEFIESLVQGSFAELVNRTEHNYNDARMVVLCFEKYYMRNDSTAALTIIVSELNDETNVELIAFGGGQGLLNLSWGANKSFARSAISVLQEFGFNVTEKIRL